MGNRTELGNFPPFINPKNNPYLHIQRLPSRKYMYNPALEGITATEGMGVMTTNGLAWKRGLSINIPLLPDLDTIPPPQFDTKELVVQQIALFTPAIIELIRPDSNVIALMHGVYWGFLPEDEVADLLVSEGYEIGIGYLKTGGRKRIQEHAVFFRRSPIDL